MTSIPGKAARWHGIAERGSVLGIRILVVTSDLFGRRLASLFVSFVAAWYVVFDGRARRASHDFLRRIRGRCSWLETLRHIRCFAQITLDRLFLLRGRLSLFRIATHGEENLLALAREKKGALIILAHLGSFEVLRALSAEKNHPTNILGYFQNAPLINSVLHGLNPALDSRLIEIRPGDPSFVFEIENRIQAGEIVGTMGDRVGLGGKSTRVPFLGGLAPFPTGPYLLASLLRCPVLLAFGLFQMPDRYDLYCEPFADTIDLPRAGRDEALRALVGRYALRLETYCRKAPENWFNFFDFWEGS